MIIEDFNPDATEDINELEAAQQTFRALAQYCVARIEAIGHRRKGRIQSAALEETRMQGIYDNLPESVRW